jgi:hypothetical protein
MGFSKLVLLCDVLSSKSLCSYFFVQMFQLYLSFSFLLIVQVIEIMKAIRDHFLRNMPYLKA